jgi:hypothetical protein
MPRRQWVIEPTRASSEQRVCATSLFKEAARTLGGRNRNGPVRISKIGGVSPADDAVLAYQVEFVVSHRRVTRVPILDKASLTQTHQTSVGKHEMAGEGVAYPANVKGAPARVEA